MDNQINIDTLEKFESYLRYEKQMADLSIVAYMGDLKQFEDYFGGDLLSVTSNDIRSYVVYQVEGKKAPRSINRRISSLHVFYKYALFKELLTFDPSEIVQYVKQPKSIPTFITEKQLEHLVDNQSVVSYDDILSYTLLYTLYSTGLRRSELASLNHQNVDLNQNTITIKGKGSKTRIIPISDQLKSVLTNYLDSLSQLRSEKGSGLSLKKESVFVSKKEENVCEKEKESLFLTHKLKPISYDQIYSIIKKMVKQFGLPSNCSPHTLRHTFATHLLNQNVPLRSIQELLGHSNLNATQIYTHTSTEELKKTFNNAHPRA